MARNYKELSNRVNATPERQARVERYKAAIRDAVSLGELRESRSVTQESLAASLKVSQANVSRVEHQDDLYLSTLTGYVAALGGELRISAVFPDRSIDLFQPAREEIVSSRVKTVSTGVKGGVQVAKSRKTSARVAKAASKVLKDGRTGKASKSAAASALSQRAPKKSK